MPSSLSFGTQVIDSAISDLYCSVVLITVGTSLLVFMVNNCPSSAAGEGHAMSFAQRVYHI